MGYTLSALVARCEVFAEVPAWIADSVIITLPQGFCMLPLSDGLRGQFGPEDRPWLYATHGIFMRLPEDLVPRAAELSRRGRVAYVEAEYFGGAGEQRAMVWEDGAVRDEPAEHSFAINDALSTLGVEHGEAGDRFDALDLGRHRSVDDWLAAANAPAAPLAPAPEPVRRPWWRFWR